MQNVIIYAYIYNIIIYIQYVIVNIYKICYIHQYEISKQVILRGDRYVKFFTASLSLINLISLYEMLNNPKRGIDIVATLIKLLYGL